MSKSILQLTLSTLWLAAVMLLVLPLTTQAQTAEPDLTVQLVDINFLGGDEHEAVGLVRNIGNSATNNSWENAVRVDLGCDGTVDQTILTVDGQGPLTPGEERYFTSQFTVTPTGNHCLELLTNPNFGSFTESLYSNNLSGQNDFPNPGTLTGFDPAEPPEIEFFAGRKGGGGGWEPGSVSAFQNEFVEVTWNSINATECKFERRKGTHTNMDIPSTNGAVSGIAVVDTSNKGTIKLGVECEGPGGTVESKTLHIGIVETNAPNTVAEVSVDGGPWSAVAYLTPSDPFEIRWSVDNFDPNNSFCVPGRTFNRYTSTRDNVRWTSHETAERLGVYGKGFDIGPQGTFSTEYAHPTFGNTLEYVDADHWGYWTSISCRTWQNNNDSLNKGQSIELFVIEDDADAPVVDLMGRSGSLNQWTRESFTIGDGQELQLRWESTDATSCDSSDFETYGSPINIQEDVDEPLPGDSRTYTITCTGPGGTGTDSITVSSSDTEVYVPPTGGAGGDVDLAALAPGMNVTSVPTNNIDGTYLNLPALLQIENLGPDDLPADGVGYYATLDLDPLLGLSDLQTSIGSFNSGLPAGDSSPTLTRTFPEVKFGNHELCSEVNTVAPPGGSIFPETNTGNNINCTNVSLQVPPPPMLLLSNQSFIRGGQSTDLEWEVNVSYELNCRVTGPTVNSSFDTPGEISGNITTGILESTSIFRLTCTEPVTGSSFSTDATVEVVPSYQEI